MTWLIFICVFLVLVLVFVLFVLMFKLLSVLRIAGDTNGLVERLGEISSCQLSADKLDNLFNQVSALSKILGGVKTKGVWGEAQLLAIFEDIMTSNQYVRNVSTKNNSSRVEFAVKIPSKSNDSQFVFLPVDSKCPMESYSRIVDCVNSGDYEGFVSEQKVLAQRVKAEAKSICEKYINPPVTTDFAVMFVPIESMYSEILRIDGLFTWCQTNCHVLIAGPTVLTALLNSLTVGFSTLAISQKTKDVIDVMSSVKYKCDRFDDLIGKTDKKLNEAVSRVNELKRCVDEIRLSLDVVGKFDDDD